MYSPQQEKMLTRKGILTVASPYMYLTEFNSDLTSINKCELSQKFQSGQYTIYEKYCFAFLACKVGILIVVIYAIYCTILFNLTNM
jgi:hypothetical protein